MLRLFGETSDQTASFAAARGDESSESPLRELALGAMRPAAAPGFLSGTAPVEIAHANGERPLFAAGDPYAGVASDAFARAGARFSPPAVPGQYVPAIAQPALLTAAYKPEAPAASISPDPGTLAFGETPGESVTVPVAATAARLQFDEHADLSLPGAQLAPHDNSADAGANFSLRAGKRSLSFNVASGYEHLERSNAGGLSSAAFDPSSSWQLPGGSGPGVVPSYSDLNRFSIRAGLAVPVVRGLTLDVNYGAQRLYGGYGLPGLLDLDAANNTYGGKLSFQIPYSSSALSIGAYQDRYQDNLLPINGYTQTREDVNFTVKF